MSNEKSIDEQDLFNVVELVAKSSNVEAADDIISAFFPKYDIMQKFDFLQKNFNFQIVCGSEGKNEPYVYYKHAIKSILSDVRDFGISSVKKINVTIQSHS